jgi:hypothetical protein
VSVVLPFYGDEMGGREAIGVLDALQRREDDELLLADNTPDGVAGGLPAPADLTVVDASAVRSPYSARNMGAARARCEWLLFIDGDCRPRPDLLDRFFEPHPRAGLGALAGQVLGASDQPGLVPSYIRSRGFLRQDLNARHVYRPMAVTANLLVRRSAFESIDGFVEGARSGADADFCWRLQEAGWALELREAATVEHWHRETLPALLRQVARDGAGLRWLEQRHPGSSPRPLLARRLARSVGGAAVWTVRGKPEAAAFKLVDGLVACAEWGGYLVGNEYGRSDRGQSTGVR